MNQFAGPTYCRDTGEGKRRRITNVKLECTYQSMKGLLMVSSFAPPQLSSSVFSLHLAVPSRPKPPSLDDRSPRRAPCLKEESCAKFRLAPEAYRVPFFVERGLVLLPPTRDGGLVRPPHLRGRSSPDLDLPPGPIAMQPCRRVPPPPPRPGRPRRVAPRPEVARLIAPRNPSGGLPGPPGRGLRLGRPSAVAVASASQVDRFGELAPRALAGTAVL